MWTKTYGPITDKSDVYSYGMLLLEMVGIRKKYLSGVVNIKGKHTFPAWVSKKAMRSQLKETTAIHEANMSKEEEEEKEQEEEEGEEKEQEEEEGEEKEQEEEEGEEKEQEEEEGEEKEQEEEEGEEKEQEEEEGEEKEQEEEEGEEKEQEEEGEGEEGEEVLEKMYLTGVWCIPHIPSNRPSMSKVIQMLKGPVEIEIPPNPFPEGLNGGNFFSHYYSGSIP
ncbi:hypothetical protein H6P81_002702 [Aristolochia fimbriata]|uniref:Protein kinase domain-containing protein n=1 Tax=Aristolochia fimbriata TaxID=158543 RepID=A0AAV7FC64_ARIFI|nr:hypothetical protein H6P81_002702 [Aristolochia fimbriata]